MGYPYWPYPWKSNGKTNFVENSQTSWCAARAFAPLLHRCNYTCRPTWIIIVLVWWHRTKSHKSCNHYRLSLFKSETLELYYFVGTRGMFSSLQDRLPSTTDKYVRPNRCSSPRWNLTSRSGLNPPVIQLLYRNFLATGGGICPYRSAPYRHTVAPPLDHVGDLNFAVPHPKIFDCLCHWSDRVRRCVLSFNHVLLKRSAPWHL